MKRMLIFLCLIGLAACGIDGEPIAPTKGDTGSGQAEIGDLALW